MKAVAGKRWFYALGHSHEARRVPYSSQRTAMVAWPLWARRAYCDGRLDVCFVSLGSPLKTFTNAVLQTCRIPPEMLGFPTGKIPAGPIHRSRSNKGAL